MLSALFLFALLLSLSLLPHTHKTQIPIGEDRETLTAPPAGHLSATASATTATTIKQLDKSQCYLSTKGNQGVWGVGMVASEGGQNVSRVSSVYSLFDARLSVKY